MTVSQSLRRVLLAATAAFLLSHSSAFAAETGTVSGTVLLPDGAPVTDAIVELVTLHRRLRVDAQGAFRFENVPAGRHIVQVSSLRSGNAVVDVDVAPGQEVSLQLGVELTTHRESIVVSASATPQRLFEVGTSADVLDAQEIAKRSGTTLGATLANQPGVNQTYFGSGASRPIVRGLGGDRVRMLESGVGTGDLSDISPDHAVTAEALTAEQVEILRGPATLLYGSSAIGGVVNVIDEAIPTHQADEAIGGTVDLRAGTVADERTGSAVVGGGGSGWAWSAYGLKRETDDYEIPGFARLDEHAEEEEHGEEGEEHEEEEEPNPRGRLPNSDLESQLVGAGFSRFFGENGDAGYLGVSVSGFETNYGITEGAHEHAEEEHDEGEEHVEEEEHAEEGGIRIDMERMRYDFKGAITRQFGLFDGLKARFGITDYEHDELEPDGAIGSHFENDTWEGRLELVQRKRGRLSGAFGVQGGSRDFLVTGEEANLPPSQTDNLDAFAYEQMTFDDVSFQFGARWASRDITADDPTLPDRDFDGLSGSVGLVWTPGENAIGGSLSRSVKFPTSEELYANGVHVATQTFEVGDPRLQEETSLGVDLFFRHESDRLRSQLSVFYNDFDDFIFPAFTGLEEEGQPVVAFQQQDAEYRGAEVELGIELFESDSTHVHLNLMGDIVEAELADGSNVPRIPPMRLGGGFEVKSGPWSAEAEVRWADDQTDAAINETPTAGYTVVNAFLGYRILTERVVYDLLLRGSNLTDEEVRLHTSYLKTFAPLPGRDFGLSLRMSF
jgi:iron complex outermembrane receptor protein